MNYKDYIGKKVLVRADGPGVLYGTLAAKEDREVELTHCRRLWYWDGACSCSEIALSGVTKPASCKFSVYVPQCIIENVLEVIPCTEAAIKSIEAVPEWKMSK